MRLGKYSFIKCLILLTISIGTNNHIIGQTDSVKAAFETFEYEDGDTTYLMKKYFLVIYTTGPNRNQSDEEANKLQTKHLAYQSQMAEDKKICLAGPFGDDGDWRGVLVLSVPDETAAKVLVDNDPMVKAGRLGYIIKPWWAAVGSKLF